MSIEIALGAIILVNMKMKRNATLCSVTEVMVQTLHMFNNYPLCMTVPNSYIYSSAMEHTYRLQILICTSIYL